MRISILIILFLFGACSSGLKSAQKGETQSTFQRALFEEELERNSSASDWIPLKKSAAHYSYMRAEFALQNDNVPEAIKYFEKNLKQDDTPSQFVRQRLVELYIRSAKLEDALVQIDEILDVDTDNQELLFLKAGVLNSLKRTDEAIDSYQQVITLGSRSEDAHLLLASLHAEKKDYKQAQSILRDYLKIDSSSFLARYYLGRMYEADKQYLKAERSYKQTRKLSPNSVVVSYDLARVMGIQRKFEPAIAIVKKALKVSPDNEKLQDLLSELLSGDGRFEEAEDQLKEMQQLGSSAIKTKLKLALLKLQQRDFEGAVVDLSLILAEDPDNSSALYYIASAYASLKKNDAAISALQKISPDQEFYLESRTFLSYVHKENGDYESAVKALKDIFKIRPDNPRVYTLIIAIYRQAKDTKKAIANLEKLIELEPDVDKHKFLLGVIYDELGEKKKAISAMKESLELNPENSNALNYLGYTYAEMGQNLDEAEVLIKKAIEIEPANAYFIDSLGWVQYKRGDYEEALATLKKAVSIVKDDAVILEHYALTLEKLNQIKEASFVASQALQYVSRSEDKDVGNRLRAVVERLQNAR